jgi:preprotein translocase subunit SecA
MHLIDSSLRAQLMYKVDIDYVVEENQIIIIDEFSGRKMPGRRWSEGLHQSIEAKENVTIQNDNQTYASITFQNYFRLFNKISGMTGTADTEATEFQQIYNLEVVAIPTHKKMIRNDHVDLVYLTMKEKYRAIVDEVKKIHDKQQPILIGTTSIESSELLSKLLKKENIKHSVLNAKHHQKEAQIIADAGKINSVTIATNMAGRGTDIVLGGSKLIGSNTIDSNSIDEVQKLGGLHIIGTERHESRRIDNQLRGRSGRQGDPGESRFFLSLEDNLMRIFASDKVSDIMKKLGMQEGEAIEHKWVSKSIENAQKRVEAHNFDIRKTLLEYDDISNEQRKVIYNQRDQILKITDFSEVIKNIIEQGIVYVLENNINRELPIVNWDLDNLMKILNNELNINLNFDVLNDKDSSNYYIELQAVINKNVIEKIQINLKDLNEKDKSDLFKNIVLTVIDENWRNHLNAMDYLRQGIGLRGYAQKNPKNEYKRESFEMFEEMLLSINYEITKILTRIKINNSNKSNISNNITKSPTMNSNKKSNDPRCLLNSKNIDIPRNKKCPVTNMKFKQCCGKI